MIVEPGLKLPAGVWQARRPDFAEMCGIGARVEEQNKFFEEEATTVKLCAQREYGEGNVVAGK